MAALKSYQLGMNDTQQINVARKQFSWREQFSF